MKNLFLSSLKYILSIGIAGLLLWLIYREQDLGALVGMLGQTDLSWVLLSVAISLVSHFSRGWRWALTLRPLGYQVKPFHAFLAVMTGYLVNIPIPRGGEVARCGVLLRTDGVPVNISFGAVVAERAFDLIMLLSLTTLTILLEFDRIGGFVLGRLTEAGTHLGTKYGSGPLPWLLAAAGLVGLIALGLAFRFRTQLLSHPLIAKGWSFVQGLKDGLLGVLRLRRGELALFVFHTVLIWAMYYLMGYVLFFSMPETTSLGAIAGLTVLVMSGIGVVIPTPGGIGSYHLFVMTALMAYGIGEDTGRYFAALMHGSQMLSLIGVGLLSLGLSFWVNRR